jgi:hypothetical protein
LQQQPEVVADGSVVGDLTVDDAEDVHLFVVDALAGGFEAVERSGVFASHGGRSHYRVLGDRLVQFKSQIGEGVAQPLAGRGKARRALTPAFHVVGVVLGLGIDVVGRDDSPGTRRSGNRSKACRCASPELSVHRPRLALP